MVDPGLSQEPSEHQKDQEAMARGEYLNAKLAREVAETAVSEYEKGFGHLANMPIFVELRNAESRRATAERQWNRSRIAQEKLRELLAAKTDEITSTDIRNRREIEDRVETTEIALAHAILELEQVRKKRRQEFSEGDRSFDPARLPEVVLKELKVDVEKRCAIELAKKRAWELEKSKVEARKQ